MERAKRFIAQKAHKLALAAIPLAALAISAVPLRAGTLNLTTCGVSHGIGSGTCTYGEFPGGKAGDIQWIQLAGSGSAGNFLDFGNSGGGTASGPIKAETIPVSWLLSVSGANLAVDPVHYSFFIGLSYALPGGGTGSSFYNQAGTWSAPGTYSATGSFNVPAATLTGWQLDLNTNDNGSAYTINIPAGATIDLNPASATPEPGSMLLIGAGGAAMFLLRRRKQA